jgi:hypothetical protein
MITICAAFVVASLAVVTQIAFRCHLIVVSLTIFVQVTILSLNADACRHDQRSQNQAADPQGNPFALV